MRGITTKTNQDWLRYCMGWLNEMSAIVHPLKTKRQQIYDMAAGQSEHWREKKNKSSYKQVYKFSCLRLHNCMKGHLTVYLIFLWERWLECLLATSCSRQCCQATLLSRTLYQETLWLVASSKTASFLWKTQMEAADNGRWAICTDGETKEDREPALWSHH